MLIAPTAVSRADEHPACTQIGCESGVSVDVRAYRVAHPEIRRLVVCVDRHCEVHSWKRGAEATHVVEVRTAETERRAVTVKVVAYDRRGRKRLRKVGTAFLRKVQPNGPECYPICFRARMHVSRHGRLRDGFAH